MIVFFRASNNNAIFYASKPILFMRYLSLLLLPIIFFSCQPQQETIVKEQALNFAKKLEYSLKKRDPKIFDSIINFSVFGRRVAIEANSKPSNSFSKSVSDAMQKRKFGEQMVASLGKDGTYEFINYYELEGKHHLIFRLYSAEGLNYHDMELVKIDGKIKAADMFIYLTGENLSKTLGSIMGKLEKYLKENSEAHSKDFTKQLTEIKSLMNDKKYEEAKKLFNMLPASIKKEKVFLVYNIMISSELGDEAYQRSMEDFEALYAGDAASQLALIDAYIIRKDFSKALNAVNIIDSAVKKDPLLHFYRAMIYTQMNDVANTIKFLELLKKEKPGFEDGWIELIANYADTRQYEKAKLLVAEYKNNNLFNQDNLENIRYLYPDAAKEIGLNEK